MSFLLLCSHLLCVTYGSSLSYFYLSGVSPSLYGLSFGLLIHYLFATGYICISLSHCFFLFDFCFCFLLSPSHHHNVHCLMIEQAARLLLVAIMIRCQLATTKKAQKFTCPCACLIVCLFVYLLLIITTVVCCKCLYICVLPPQSSYLLGNFSPPLFGYLPLGHHPARWWHKPSLPHAHIHHLSS